MPSKRAGGAGRATPPRKQVPRVAAPPSPGIGLPGASGPILPASLFPASPAIVNDKPKLDGLIKALEAARNRRVLIYWTSPVVARLSEAAVLSMFDQLQEIGKVPELDLFLFTSGGDIEAPWRIVSLIREFATKFSVLIPHRAASAGTLLAMGADEIVMTPLASLGPIDPSRTHPLLPRREGSEEAEAVSVQDMRHAMQFIRDAVGEDQNYSSEAFAEIFKVLVEKIHPLAIGAIEQSYALAKLIGIRCLSSHMKDLEEAAQVEKIVNRLCDDYKSHAYQIARNEAREIGLKAVDAPPDVESAMMDLYRFYIARPFIIGQPPAPGQEFQTHLAWLDTTQLHFRVVGKAKLETDGRLKQLNDEWLAY
jgi:hypothetical protein